MRYNDCPVFQGEVDAQAGAHLQEWGVSVYFLETKRYLGATLFEFVFSTLFSTASFLKERGKC
jgi:hypothetical protein